MWTRLNLSTFTIVLCCWGAVHAKTSRTRAKSVQSTHNATSQSGRQRYSCGQHNLNLGQAVHFTSKNFPKPYPRNHRCHYEFHCDAENVAMELHCSKFEIQRTLGCNKEFVRVYDASGSLAKTCGRQPPEVTTAGGFIGVRLNTNKDKIRKSGFNCTVFCKVNTEDGNSTGVPISRNDTADMYSTGAINSINTEVIVALPYSAPPPQERCHCGEANLFTRIVGGRDTEQHEYPWQVGLVKSDPNPFCGGSLLSSQFVVTAAHCIYNTPIDEYHLIFGEHNWLNDSDSIKRNVEHVFIHPNYDHNSQDYDISLLRVSVAIDIFSFITSPVCLPTYKADYAGQIAIATGWGATSEFGPLVSSTLQEVDVRILKDSECSFSYPGRVTERMQCAGVSGGGKDSCQGDSGGPLAVKDNGIYVLTGITSWGHGCARDGKPGVYTKVQSLLPWVVSTMGNGQGCSSVNEYVNSSSFQITKMDDITTNNTTNAIESLTITPKQEISPTTTLPTLPCRCGPLIQTSMLPAHSLQNHPWTLSLFSSGKQKKVFCSGTIITTKNVLTAANCVHNRSLSSFHIRANEETFGESKPGSITRKVVEVVINNELALLKLLSPISLTRYPALKPACLPQNNQVFIGFPNIHSGYDLGRVMATSGTWIANENPYWLTFSSKTEAFCGEDLGGPIISKQGDHNYLAGIAIDSECGNNQKSAKISAYYNWIMTHHSGRFCSM